MVTQEILIREIEKQPDAVIVELWHYLKFIERQRQEDEWADVLPDRKVEEEVLNIIDGHGPETR